MTKELREVVQIAQNKGFQITGKVRRGEVWLEKGDVEIRLADVSDYNFMLTVGYTKMFDFYEADFKKFKKKVKKLLP